MLFCLLARQVYAQNLLPDYQVYFGKTPEGWLSLRRWQEEGEWNYLFYDSKDSIEDAQW